MEHTVDVEYTTTKCKFLEKLSSTMAKNEEDQLATPINLSELYISGTQMRLT